MPEAAINAVWAALSRSAKVVLQLGHDGLMRSHMSMHSCAERKETRGGGRQRAKQWFEREQVYLVIGVKARQRAQNHARFELVPANLECAQISPPNLLFASLEDQSPNK